MATKHGTEARITPEMVAAILSEKGKEYPAKDQFNVEATRDTIRHYAQGVGDLNPLWLDEDYARKSRYGGITAPPTFLDSCAGRSGKLGMPGIHAFYSGAQWTFHRPARVGDTVVTSGGIDDIIEKESKFSGKTYHQWQFLNFRNQKGEMIATVRQLLIRAERQTAVDKGKYQGVETKIWTDPELAAIWKGIEDHERRGGKPRFWEDVKVGDILSPLPKGPYTLSDAVGFKMGWGSHFVHHIRANETRFWMVKRHPEIPIRNSLNIPDCPEAVHMIDTTAKNIGFPAFYDYGYQRVAWMAQLVTDWMSDDAWLKELDVRITRPNIVGDCQWYRGKVLEKVQQGTECLVKCEITGENQNGDSTSKGTALVILPVRKGR